MKIFVLFIQVSCFTFALSSGATGNDKENTIFGKSKNQISVSGGQSYRSAGTEDLFYGDVTYSQPASFFRREARKNLEFGFFRGADCSGNCDSGSSDIPNPTNLSQYDLSFFGISGDVVFFDTHHFYGVVRLGAYIKSKTSNRVSSAFTFGERLGLGYRFDTQGINLELYARHFSNGTLTDQNSGQNSYGITVGYDF